jgi:hypothetical protein
MRATFSIPVTQQSPQGFGSAITYIKRFSLAAAVGVAPKDDDDGEEAMKGYRAKPSAVTHQEYPKAQVKLSKTDQQIQFWKMAKNNHWSNDEVLEKMRLLFKKEKTDALSEQEMAVLWGLVETNPKAEKKAAL